MTATTKIDRKTIDNWPIEEAGFSQRITKCAQREGLVKVGQLRNFDQDELLNWRNLGLGSLKELDRYFELCGLLEEGQIDFSSIPEVLEYFLKKEEMAVIFGRYGLDRKNAEASRNYYTLQALGNRRNVTRERVRQVEADSLKTLSSRIVMAFLEPFLTEIRGLMDKRQGIVGCGPLFEMRNGIFGEMNPCALLLLIADLDRTGIDYRRNVFTILGVKAVDRIYNAMLERLKKLDTPVEISEIVEKIEPEDAKELLKDVKNLLSTRDGKLLYSMKSLENYLISVMPEDEEIVHYKALMRAANRGLAAPSRKGEGFYLQRIAQMEAFERLGFGEYRIQRPA